MKPILRYTVSNVKRSGFICLAESIRLMKKLYDFDIFICYNNLTKDQFEFIQTLEVNLIEAQPFSLPLEPRVENWKLYPPRIDISRHEIVIDNDYLLIKKLEEIDKFLESDLFLLSEDNDRNLGQFSARSDFRMGVNSGLYGMPPHYNFQLELANFLTDVEEWSPRFDDQGILSCLFQTKPHILIPLCKVPFICSDYRLRADTYGYHFVQVNRIDHHIGWNDYLRKKLYA